MSFDVSPLGAPSTGATGDGDWKTVHRADDAEGVTTPDRPGEGLRKNQIKILFNPVPVKQNPGAVNDLPQGTHSPVVRQDNYGGKPIKVKLPYDKYPDEGTREYYYAPGQGSLTDSGRQVQARALTYKDLDVLAGIMGIGPAVPAAAPPSLNDAGKATPDTYHEDQTNYAPGPDGFKDLEQDSNFSQKPKTWRFKRRDKDVSITPLRNQTNLPEPEHAVDQGLEDVVWPLTGSTRPRLLFFEAGYGDVGRGYRFSKPTLVSTYKGGPEALVNTTVSVHGVSPKVDGEYFDVRFWMAVNPRNKAKVALSQNLPVEVYEFPAGDAVMPEGGPLNLEDNAQARWLSNHIPLEVLSDAAELMGLDYMADEAASKEVKDARVDRKEAEADVQREKAETAKKRAEEEEAKQAAIQKRIERKQAEKVGNGRGKPYNVLEDPTLQRLAPDMTTEEKLFTTIRDWDEDEYTTTLDRLDAGTRKMLEAKPTGDGKYFYWDVVTEDEAKKLSESRKKEMGSDPSGDLAGKGLLNVKRKQGWKDAEPAVQQARKESKLT